MLRRAPLLLAFLASLALAVSALAGDAADAPEVHTHTHIASLQLAAVRMGFVDEIVWLRPRWAETLPDGPRTFQIGEVANGELGVDDESDHHVLDEGCAPAGLALPADPATRVAEVRALTEVVTALGAGASTSLPLQLQAVLTPATVIRFDDGLRPAPRPPGGVAPIEAPPRAAAAAP